MNKSASLSRAKSPLSSSRPTVAGPGVLQSRRRPRIDPRQPLRRTLTDALRYAYVNVACVDKGAAKRRWCRFSVCALKRSPSSLPSSEAH